MPSFLFPLESESMEYLIAKLKLKKSKLVESEGIKRTGMLRPSYGEIKAGTINASKIYATSASEDVIKKSTHYRTFTVRAYYGQKINEIYDSMMTNIGQSFIEISEEAPEHHHFIQNITIKHFVTNGWPMVKQGHILKFFCVVSVTVFYREKEVEVGYEYK